MIKKIAAAALLAAAALFVAPTAASALDDPGYGGSELNAVVSGNAVPGGTVTVTWPAGKFRANEAVAFAVEGETDVTLAAVITGPFVKNAAGDGSAVLRITLPSDARGTYEVTAAGTIDPVQIGTAVFTVSPAGSGAGTGTGSTTGNGLASTGQDVPMTALFVGGGALLLGAVVMGAVYTTRRRSVARQN